MNITQNFYDSMATSYDKLFENWQATTKEQGLLLDGIFRAEGYDKSARVLDCACGIGTQAIGIAALGYDVSASDISREELREAAARAENNGVSIRFTPADFCALHESFDEKFDIIIAMDNALPHMLTHEALEAAVKSICAQLAPGGMFVASIRDYDTLLMDKPPYSPPYIHKTDEGQRVSFQTWHWEGENYRLVQYILEDGETLSAGKFECEYRATRREEMTALLKAYGCGDVRWLFPEDSGFYQPIVVARK